MEVSLFKNWWWLTASGIAAIIFGLIAIFYPEVTLLLLLIYFGILALFLSGFFILGAFLNKDETDLWPFWIFEGVLNGIIGIALLFSPQITVTVFLLLLAIWAVLIGVIQIVSVIKLWKVFPHKYLYLLNGIIAMVFGVIVALNPLESAIAMTIFIGIYTIILGVFSILISFKMKAFRESFLDTHTTVFKRSN